MVFFGPSIVNIYKKRLDNIFVVTSQVLIIITFMTVKAEEMHLLLDAYICTHAPVRHSDAMTISSKPLFSCAKKAIL